MKRFFSTLFLAVACLLSPQKSQAADDCLFYWNPVMNFFNAGGTVVVQHSGGGGYMVSHPYSTDQYSLQNGDEVFVFPGSCATQAWSWTWFGACNNQGGITFQTPLLNTISGAMWVELGVTMNCNCPNGSSSGSLYFIKAKYCQAGGGGQ